jgi:hypothetical protein
MLDCETWGTVPGCAVRSIGAVAFTLSGPEPSPEKTFYANIDTHSCLYARLHIERGTAEWWQCQSQSQKARDDLKQGAKPLAEVANDFAQWCRALPPVNDLKVWSQGANFDPNIWEAAARAVNAPIPWKYYNVRDTRTLYDLAQFDTLSIPRRGTYHNALDDARHQAACCRAAYAALPRRPDSL